MTTMIKIALIQMCATPDVEANMATTLRQVTSAAEQGAKIVFLPEAFAFIGPDREKRLILESLADTADVARPILEKCQEIASQHGIHLVLGGFHEVSDDPERSYNTCVHLGTDGAILARYRKMHLFDVELADGTFLKESKRTLAGSLPVITDTPFGCLGLTICYDVRFPNLYQKLVDMGAIALSVPSAFTATTGAAHWHTLLRARAIESQCYVIAAAQYGNHHGRRYSYGHSLVVDPWGEIIAEAATDDAVLIADIDPARVQQVRSELPSLQHRRALN
jgi:predicted amidohydrolase